MYDGRISIRDKAGQEYKQIREGGAGLVFGLVGRPRRTPPIYLAVGCWDQTLVSISCPVHSISKNVN